MVLGSPSTADAGDGGLAFRLYDFTTGDEDARLCRDIPDDQCREQPRSFLYQVFAQALSKTGDVLADTKVVLPWPLGAVGALAFLIGVLAPIRESLALLPQILVGGVVRRFAVRKGFWVVSSLVEGLCAVLMGLVAVLGLRGAGAGWTIVGLLSGVLLGLGLEVGILALSILSLLGAAVALIMKPVQD